MFRVIEGGLSARPRAAGEPADDAVPNREDVLLEAARRIGETGYETWRNRETLTGIPIPREIRYLTMQIGYVAEAFGRLTDIPADFRSDIYWPG